jgi:hypothetical protein
MACVFVRHQINRLESHFILKSLSNRHIINPQVVCKNSETITSLSIGDSRLVDSANFMDYSLYELVRCRRDGLCVDMWNEQFPMLYNVINNARQFKLVVNEIGLLWIN